MRKPASIALMLGLVACTEPAPRAPPPPPPPEEPEPPDLGSAYAEIMDQVGEDVAAKTTAAARRDYETYAEAKAALDEVLPENALGRIDGALDERSLTKAQLAAYMRENPEVVQRVMRRVEERLREVEPELARLMAKVAALAPPGDNTADKLRELGYAHLIEGDAKKLEWISIDSAAGFDAAAAKARKENKALLLHLGAHWCLPCKELERKTFAARDVAALLAESVVVAKLDVSEGAAWHVDAQKALGSASLPTVAIWAADTRFPPRALERARLPDPALNINAFVPPAEFLAKLRPVLEARD